MSRRTVAGLLAGVLIVVLWAIAANKPVPYVTFRPGPTLNVLGEYDGKQIIKVTGHRVYRDKGGLRMVTVYPSGPDDDLGWREVMWGWLNPDIAVLPKGAVYKKNQTNKSVQQQSAVQMTSSQDDAVAAALGVLGITYEFRTDISIATVAKGGAADGILKKGDVVQAVNGHPVADSEALVSTIRALKPGTAAKLTIRRNSAVRTLSVTTQPAADDPKASRINVSIAQRQRYVFPFKVKVQLPETIGGPSAGMMFALSIYDVLTPDSLTGGAMIAGSGEITRDGIVGQIGGIGQKLVAAQRDGAKLFLVAQENCSEALRSHYDPAKMRLVKVHTLSQAIKDIDAWRANHDAKLSRCTR